jgi:hypothetical protein
MMRSDEFYLPTRPPVAKLDTRPLNEAMKFLAKRNDNGNHTHGLRNEMHISLKWPYRLMQNVRLFLATNL